MEAGHSIRRGHSLATDARQAVREFRAAVARPDTALVLFFCSSEYDLDALAEEMRLAFPETQVVGCTTAGEIGPGGYRDHSLAGASFSAAGFSAVSGCIDNLQGFEIAEGDAFAQDLLQKLESREAGAGAVNSFGLLLIDGLSAREEPVTRSLQSALGKVPMVGGSAGDGERFGSTHVYFEGRFHAHAAVLTLVSTRFPFKLFKTQHFVATGTRMVVTAADITTRIVREINGLPAAEEYARVIGIEARDLDPMRFAAWPVVVMIDGTNYVRSIQKANPDGSLTFFCAIEEGLVLRVAKGVDLLANLEEAFAAVRAEIGAPQLVLGCDCILRKLEIQQSPDKDRIEDILLSNHAVGFNTYGEQYQGVHVNQTLTGIAIGSGAIKSDHA